jgi:hypothetical protein
VRQVAVPPPARRLSTLFHADYEDAFLVETGEAESRTAEQWARAILEGPPGIMQSAVAAGWFALGLRLGSTHSDGRVLGWEVRRSSPDFVLLGASSRIGMPAEVLFKRQPHALLFATFVQQENPLARAMWAGIAPVHRQVVRQALEQVASSKGDR